MKIPLNSIIKQSKTSEFVSKPESEKYITVSGHGLGVKERIIGDGKTPVPFSAYRAKAGQLIYSRIGAGDGAFGIVPNELDNAVVSKDFPLFDIDSSQVDIDYLIYYLTSAAFCKIAQENSFGATMTRFKEEKLLSCYIELPTLSEQSIVVKSLNYARHVCSLYQQQLQSFDNLIKARFVEMFGDPVTNPKGWHKKRFDEICENLDSKRKPITASEREAGEYPYYGASGIVDYVADYIFDEDILLVSEDGANLLMRSTPIAFSVSGKVWVNNHAHVVKFDDMGLQKYIEIFISMIDISDQITGSAQPKLNQAKLNAMMFPIPDKELTDSFLNFISQVDKSKLAVQRALDKAQLLFDSLMQKYFG